MKKIITVLFLLSFNAFTQIEVDLVRQSDGVTIGTALIDEQFCGQSDTTQEDTTTQGIKLYFDGLASEYISCDYTFSGEFDLVATTQGVSDVGGWIGLCGANSSNRILLSNSNQRFWGNIGSGTLKKKNSLVYDSGLVLKTRIYRDSVNDIYIQFNNEAPIYCFNSPNTVTINQICRAHDKYFKGYLLSYQVNGEIWNLSEGSGTVLTGSNGTIHTLEAGTWQETPPAAGSIQVHNEGVGGNNVNQLLDRTSDVSQHSPDLIIVWTGTNGSLNAPSKILPVSDYQDSLNALIIKLGNENPQAEILLLNVIPCTDSILKTTHDYSSYYGEDSTFNLNTDIIPTFNDAIDSVATAHSLTVKDANSIIQNNIEVITDGTHISATGYGLIAALVEPNCNGKTVIVCFGDSLTEGVNAGGGFDYPTQLEQLLNN